MNENNEKHVETLPLLPLRGLLTYPNMMLKVDVGREKSLAAIDAAMQGDHRVILVAQRDSLVEDPGLNDVYGVGTVALIRQAVRLPDGTMRLLVEGEKRAVLTRVQDQDDMQVADLRPFVLKSNSEALELTALMRAAKTLFHQFARAQGEVSSELLEAVDGEGDPQVLPDLIAANAVADLKDKQIILETRAANERLHRLCSILSREIQLVEMEKRIQERVRVQLDQRQKEFYLNEQMAAIREELGEGDDQEKEELASRLEESAMNAEAREKTERELRRYRRMTDSMPEASTARGYIETMLELPWGVRTKDNLSVEHARRVFDQDHYGLDKVKERIVEYIAVSAVKGSLRGPILCLVGPPGVGKTSIAKSVARALGRKFTRMSLGGLRDEAEIRGHRRTYIGAIPGRIIAGLRTCKSENPVFLLDEIDKMTQDMRGDPASALLEALDPEQNGAFTDHYIEAPFDLSGVLFLTTANSAENIPAPLLDRMELIAISGYTLEEKEEIALRHLWPKALKEHGLTKARVKLPRETVARIIDGYTRESGVRALEQLLAKLCRKAAVALAGEGAPKSVTVNEAKLEEYLGAPKYLREEARKTPETGTVNGLAWTPFGGETLSIEVAVMPGKGAIDLTGSLGDVMKESARTAYSYIRSKADAFGIDPAFHEHHDLHIHVPEGATPKDGPSAGVALTCAMVSAITGRKARQDVAMTGEITLRGRVLPIGGVKEKLLAAHRMGIDTVLLPGENKKDLEELPGEVRSQMRINLIGQVDQALGIVLAT